MHAVHDAFEDGAVKFNPAINPVPNYDQPYISFFAKRLS